MPRLPHQTFCSPTKSNLHLANFLATAVSEPDLYRLLTFQVPNLMSLFHFFNVRGGFFFTATIRDLALWGTNFSHRWNTRDMVSNITGKLLFVCVCVCLWSPYDGPIAVQRCSVKSMKYFCFQKIVLNCRRPGRQSLKNIKFVGKPSKTLVLEQVKATLGPTDFTLKCTMKRTKHLALQPSWSEMGGE